MPWTVSPPTVPPEGDPVCGRGEAGELNPILRRLLEAGLVEARWATDDEGTGPRRHLYRLTAEGRAVAVARAAPVSPWAPPRPAQARP